MVSLGYSQALKIYVSPQGNDTGDGSAQHPVATLDRAQELWRQALTTPSERFDKIQVFLAGCDYFLTQTLLLEEADRRIPLTISAMPGEKPILFGSQPVAGWKTWKRISLGADSNKGTHENSHDQREILVAQLSESETATCFPSESSFFAPGQLFQA
ncbi:MAG: hypothetical protein Q4D38_12350 [Planctomycetia bacterium]|nr:hypothetical protein [Planctomycetia bacterium]